MVLLEDAVDECLVCEIALNKGVVLELLKLCQTNFLDANIIIIVHIVQTNHLGIRLSGQNTLGKVGADKTRCACDEYCFIHFLFPFIAI